VADVGFIDPQLDDWNVPPTTFEQQIASLAKYAEIVPLLDLPKRLAERDNHGRPIVCLTFDDGYSCVMRCALPILKRYNAPATFFVVTKYIGWDSPMPFDRWSHKNSSRVSRGAWRALEWKDIEACLSSGLVTIGAHSHEHRDGRECSAAQLNEEAERSREILLHHFGEEHARAYAYPYGSTRLGEVNTDYVNAVKKAGFSLAVSTDLGLATAKSDPFLLPRVEAHALDSGAVMRAKAIGALAPYKFTDRLRQATRTA
ncbi:MAG TPA: polysaccharide deacetylase family protein, partial [Blastocatellia bacterium]|nr:polysaccharide deacetylase family protein [Blastocatellia bacterium]